MSGGWARLDETTLRVVFLLVKPCCNNVPPPNFTCGIRKKKGQQVIDLLGSSNVPITSVPGSAVYSAVREGGTDGVHNDRLEDNTLRWAKVYLKESSQEKSNQYRDWSTLVQETIQGKQNGLCGIRIYTSCSRIPTHGNSLVTISFI